MCIESSPSTSMVLPMKMMILKTMVLSDDDSPAVREVRTAIRNDQEQRYTGLQDYLNNSTALDPRFKSLLHLDATTRLRVYDALTTETVSIEQQDWKVGSRCRVVYSEDGLVYPAVVLWVRGRRCCVRFDDYNNEEEHDLSSLLTPDELHGPSRAAAAKVKDRPSNQSKVEKETEEKKKRRNQQRDEADKPTSHSFSVFPPFPPPPPHTSSGDPVSFIPPPPPPPLWMFGESGSSAGANATSSMLMLWYMCGFHTGSYMAQQLFRSNSKD